MTDSYTVKTIPAFERQASRLAKKYRSFATDLRQLVENLSENPTQGVALGGGAFKVRFAIRSKGRGKSGGGRVIYFIVTHDREIWLLAIYDKSELASVDSAAVKQLIADI